MPSKTSENVYIGPLLDHKKQDYKALKNIFQKLKSRPDIIYLSMGELHERGVKVTPLNLSSGTAATSKGAKQFFQPRSDSEYAELPQKKDYKFGTDRTDDYYKAYDINISLNGYLNHELPEAQTTEDKDAILMFTEWEKVGVPGDSKLCGYSYTQGCKESYSWQGDHAYGIRAKENDAPHLIYFTKHGISPDAGGEPKITRSELLLLIDVMMGRMGSPALFANTIYPVLMVSVFGDKIRVLQGYFEGGVLHVQYSRFINYQPFDKPGFDLLLRWILCNPVGDTTTPTGKVEPKDLVAIRDTQKKFRHLTEIKA